LILAAVLFAVTSLGNALAHNFIIFIGWRILGGVGIGLASNLSPMYIAEIAPAQVRGKLVAIISSPLSLASCSPSTSTGFSSATCPRARPMNTSVLPGLDNRAGAGCLA